MPKTKNNFKMEAKAIFAEAQGESKLPSITIDPAYAGGKINVGWGDPVVIDLSSLTLGTVSILKDHSDYQLLGQGTATVTGNKIVVTGSITGDTETPGTPANEVMVHARNGFTWPASVGVIDIGAVDYIDDSSSAEVNGKSIGGPFQLVRNGRLGEVSLVSVAADSAAKSNIKGKGEKTMDPKFKAWLEAAGHKAEEVSGDELKSLQAKYDSEVAVETKVVAPVKVAAKAEGVGEVNEVDEVTKNIRVSAAAEVMRIDSINSLQAKYSEVDEVAVKCAEAIKAGVTPETVELDLLRASRPAAPAVHTGTEASADKSVYEIGMLRASGNKNVITEKNFTPAQLENADSVLGSRGMGINEIICASAEAVTGKRYRKIDAGNIGEVLRASGFSNTGLAGVISDSANKILLSAYMSGDDVDMIISKKTSVNDFKTHTRYRLTANDKFEVVGPGGEIKSGKMTEDTYTVRADTYGKKYAITRQDIINDDLGMFDQLKRNIGQGGAKARRSAVWTAFMDNSTFYTDALGNYISGATTALTIDSLSAAVAKFRGQEDEYGEPIGIEPKYLLVPPALEGKAREIYASTNFADQTVSSKRGTTNIHAGRFEPLVTSYLANSTYTGYSTAAWYLLADPNDIPTTEIAFLNGMENPIVEESEVDFSQLGIQFRAYFDFGVSTSDYRGGVKSKGSA